MSYFLFGAGLLLFVWAFVEGLWTTIWIDGGSAPLTSRLTTGVWKLMRAIIGSSRHKALSLSGPIILFLTVFVWVFFTWLGWSLVFYSFPNALLDPNNPVDPITFTDTLWYVAYTMFTVGNGDFIPSPGVWQLLSALVAFSGMLLVTLSVTYLLQVMPAVVNKRAFASQVTSIAQTSEDFVLAQWNGKSFGEVELQLNALSGQLSQLNEQHMAFPLLHYYHAERKEKTSAMALAVLDDALTLIAFGVQEEYHPPQTILTSTRSTIQSHLSTLKRAFIEKSETKPPPPDLGRLREAGIPVVTDEEFRQRLQQVEDRRKLLLGLIQNAAWHWPDAKQ